MAARKPATAAEIVEALRTDVRLQKGEACPYGDAVEHLRTVLRTTTRTAMEWLSEATESDPHEFELIGTVGSRVTHVARGGEAILLDEAGYTTQKDKAYWPHLSATGELIREARTDESHDFVVMSKDLETMCAKSAKRTQTLRDQQRRLRDSSVQGAEDRHGDSLGYLRGLLKAAGVQLDQDTFNALHYQRFDGDFTTLSIHLRDGLIDAVAGVLAAHGVEPYPPSGAITLKPSDV